MARNKKGRDISGVLLLDKQSDISSNKALQQIKRLFDAKKAGHTGSLDPIATGVLPVCLGEATKFAKYLLADTKTYIAIAQLGATTTTLDSEGEVVARFPTEHITKEIIKTVVMSFLGKSLQTPPMFSALKKAGQPLYKLARKGEEVTREQREIEVFSIELLYFSNEEFSIKVKVSKGTYIRSLIDDIGKKLNSGAFITALRRVEFAHFTIDNCYTFDEIKDNNLQENDAKLLKIDTILPQFASIELTTKEYNEIQFGRKISTNLDNQTIKMLYDNQFIGIGEITNTILQPKRLVNI